MEVITVLGIHQARYAIWGGARMTRASGMVAYPLATLADERNAARNPRYS